ncbi:hypothetical protein E2C01_092213 [Portunus trituberculatus]|uniref:Uncharacterized protein n=1 Tax=Portunus trituberculatus TaxID=210409 RepID=A0A5B7JFY2_PORTR|nr:hypothetical protein [Portunus trituberculatus]
MYWNGIWYHCLSVEHARWCGHGFREETELTQKRHTQSVDIFLVFYHWKIPPPEASLYGNKNLSSDRQQQPIKNHLVIGCRGLIVTCLTQLAKINRKSLQKRSTWLQFPYRSNTMFVLPKVVVVGVVCVLVVLQAQLSQSKGALKCPKVMAPEEEVMVEIPCKGQTHGCKHFCEA